MTNDSHISSTLEDYLEAILTLAGSVEKARVGDIAQNLSVHKSTVTAALKTLTAKGLINYAPYESASLTPKGRKIAERVVHDHVAIKQFLTDVLRVRGNLAEENACRMEHVMDRSVLDRLVILANHMREWGNSENECFQRAAETIEAEMLKAAKKTAQSG